MMPVMPMPAASMAPVAQASPVMRNMQGMQHMHKPTTPQATPVSAHTGHGGETQGNAGLRSADYSDGLSANAAVHAMPNLGSLRFDQLESFHGKRDHGQRWELWGWYGNALDKLWLRSEGEHESERTSEGDIELLWAHAGTAFWDTQLGVRHDFGPGPDRTWLAAGVEGLAPYLIDVTATVYLGPSGRTAARLRLGYELLFTQRLILEPEAEFNVYGKDDPVHGIGAGLSDASLGLRLRYEIRRRFAPYVGVRFSRRFAGTADLARAQNEPVFDRQWVAGLRFWF